MRLHEEFKWADLGTTAGQEGGLVMVPAISGTPLAARPVTVAHPGEASGRAPSIDELIQEGLRQRQRAGTAAAVPCFEQAARLAPGSHLPYLMLGNATSELGDLDAAVSWYERARDIRPQDPVIRYNLGLNQLWRGYVAAALAELTHARQLNAAYVPAQTAYLMALHCSDRSSPEEISSAIRGWGRRLSAQPRPSVSRSSFEHTGLPRKLRLGFVSGDFRRHSVAYFFEPLLACGDHDRFEYFLYSSCGQRDGVTARLRGMAAVWRDVWQISDEELLRLISYDRIDILVDLSGHTEFNRLGVFARRAAPIQVTYLGYPNSTGLPSMDYRITDAITDPAPMADSWNTEALLRLPGCQWCFHADGLDTSIGPLPARKAGFVTFGSFNNLSKLSDTILDCWTQILRGVPDSRLRLTRVRSTQRAREISALFAQAGVAPERIAFLAYTPDDPQGEPFQEVDIALDTYPYNGVTTTCQSLWHGLPVVTLHGPHSVARSGLSILGTMGLSDLVAATPDEYVRIASSLARDWARLERLRLGLRRLFQRSALGNGRRFAANFADLLCSAWQGHRT